MIEDGFLDNGTVEELALHLGLGGRHLHRLFIQHIGASPVIVAQTRRLHFAKRLLDETNLKITDIAMASGYGSLRRFNSAFRQTYRRSPRDLRKHPNRAASSESGEVVLKLAYRPPYDWFSMCEFLEDRAIPGLETVEGGIFSRTVVSGEKYAVVNVRPIADQNALELRVRGAESASLFQLSLAARRAFDLSADPAHIALAFRQDPLLAPLVARNPGLRIPGAWDPFESAVRIILSQHVSLTTAKSQIARLVAKAGLKICNGTSGHTYLFPTADQIAGIKLEGLDYSPAKVSALKALSMGIIEGRIDFNAPAEHLTSRLEMLPGIGTRTAQYIALHALNEPDSFPAADPLLRSAASNAKDPITPEALERMAEEWRPWRAYAALYLWDASRTMPFDRSNHVRKLPA